MIHLTVQVHHFFHLPVLGYFPCRLRNPGRLRHDEHPGLDFEDVRMPQLLFFGVERGEELGRDHVLCESLISGDGIGRGQVTDPNDARVLLRRVVQDALSHVVVEVRAVVIGFDGRARWVVRVGEVLPKVSP
jgi:hypothetical protein